MHLNVSLKVQISNENEVTITAIAMPLLSTVSSLRRAEATACDSIKQHSLKADSEHIEHLTWVNLLDPKNTMT